MDDTTKNPELGGSGSERTCQNKPGNFSTVPPIEKLLPRLEGAKKTGDRKWVARCPAHDDRRPSLSIREADDGRLLLHCWSGCGGIAVIRAAGLRDADLFPRSNENRRPLRPRERWIPREAVTALAHELLAAVIIIADAQGGAPIPTRDLERLAQITGRLRAAAAEVGCHG